MKFIINYVDEKTNRSGLFFPQKVEKYSDAKQQFSQYCKAMKIAVQEGSFICVTLY